MEKIALVTGAAGGVGRAVAASLAAQGWQLAELMVWLLSDSAARVTGQVWSLDGGFSTIRPLVK